MPRFARLLSRPWFWFVAYACWFVVLYFLSEQPASGLRVDTFTVADKVAHAVYFGCGATGLGLGLLLWRRTMPRLVLLLVLMGISLAVGLFDERHQSTTPGRDGNSAGDVVADVVGGIVGFFLCQSLLGFAEKRPPVAELPE
jgi:VanZ family protein